MLNPFTAGATVSRSVTAASARVALPGTTPNQIRVISAVANAIAFIKFGDATVTAAVTDTPILPGTVEVFTIPPGVTNVAAIGTNGTTLYFTAGDGQ